RKRRRPGRGPGRGLPPVRLSHRDRRPDRPGRRVRGGVPPRLPHAGAGRRTAVRRGDGGAETDVSRGRVPGDAPRGGRRPPRRVGNVPPIAPRRDPRGASNRQDTPVNRRRPDEPNGERGAADLSRVRSSFRGLRVPPHRSRRTGAHHRLRTGLPGLAALPRTAHPAFPGPDPHRVLAPPRGRARERAGGGDRAGGRGRPAGGPAVPLCRGAELLPPGLGPRMHMLHRGWSLVVLALVLWTSTAAARAAPAGGRAITAAARLAAALVLAQFALGLLNIVTRLTPLVRGAHLGIAALLLGTLIVLLKLTRPSPAEARS